MKCEPYIQLVSDSYLKFVNTKYRRDDLLTL